MGGSTVPAAANRHLNDLEACGWPGLVDQVWTAGLREQSDAGVRHRSSGAGTLLAALS